ncbi:MAG TPA: signal recognition particle protein [Desulfurococcales archaeon]|nr:signal recognition particle protein [Desulfurococcales archaeon]
MKGLEGLREAVRKLLRSSSSYEKAVNELIRDLQRTLLKADVNVKLVFQLTRSVKKRALEEKPPPGITRREWVVKILLDELVKLFGGLEEPNVLPKKKPYIIMLVGIQGSGKTTSAAKLAYYYAKRGFKVGLVCADTFRPAAYIQLKQLGEKINIPVYGREGEKNSIKLALEGVEYFKKQNFDIIIIDTAGRHKEEKGLLEEMKNIAKAIKPDEVMLIIDASIGQQAYIQAKAFHEATPIGSIMITKMDGTAKGGGALSAVAATGAKIKFIGTGELIEDIERFSPKGFVSRLLGLGDIEALLDKIREAQLEEELAKKQYEILKSGRITLRDLYYQIKSIRRMGPLSKLLQMIPGFSLTLPSEDQLKLTEEKMDKWLAIINSMTYEELEKPSKIDRSRMRRIAIGSGTTIEDVKELLKYYEIMNKMLKQIKRRKGLLRKLHIE